MTSHWPIKSLTTVLWPIYNSIRNRPISIQYGRPLAVVQGVNENKKYEVGMWVSWLLVFILSNCGGSLFHLCHQSNKPPTTIGFLTQIVSQALESSDWWLSFRPVVVSCFFEFISLPLIYYYCNFEFLQTYIVEWEWCYATCSSAESITLFSILEVISQVPCTGFTVLLCLCLFTLN